VAVADLREKKTRRGEEEEERLREREIREEEEEEQEEGEEKRVRDRAWESRKLTDAGRGEMGRSNSTNVL
jgi:hypothetical protein